MPGMFDDAMVTMNSGETMSVNTASKNSVMMSSLPNTKTRRMFAIINLHLIVADLVKRGSGV